MADPSTLAEIHQDSKGGHKGPIVGDYDISGLSLAWDNMAPVRQKMRNKLNLLTHLDPVLKKESNHVVERNIKNVKANVHPLTPVCLLIAKNDGLLPNVDRLAAEVQRLFAINSLPISTDLAQNQAWAIRHLIGILKSTVRTDRKTGEKKFPKDHSFKTGQAIPLLFISKALKHVPLVLVCCVRSLGSN